MLVLVQSRANTILHTERIAVTGTNKRKTTLKDFQPHMMFVPSIERGRRVLIISYQAKN
jgi:hypothetical protein